MDFKKKTIVIFEISTLNLSICKISLKKSKFLNLGPKVHDLGILCLKFEDNIVIFEISTLEFV